MLEIPNKSVIAARRVVNLDPSTIAAIGIKPGMVLVQGALPNRFAVKGDGAAVIGAPLYAFVDSARKDVQTAKSISVIDGPFIGKITSDCYSGTPTLNQALKADTGGNAGKLVGFSPSTVAHTQDILAYCSMSPDADGKIEIKTVR